MLKIWQHLVKTQWRYIVSCARYWWSVYLVILRNKALNFYFGLQEPNLVLWMGGGVRGKERGYIERFRINDPLNNRINTSHRNVNQVQGAYKMVEETMFRTMMQNSHKYTSLKLYFKVPLKCTELNPFCEYF